MGFDEKLSDADQAAMRLHIGGRTYNFAHASHSAQTLSGTLVQLYTWNFTSSLPRFDWASGSAVAFKITALPIITIEAVTSTVEYGGNNNAAESTAEFKFTRTGSTDNALSFRSAELRRHIRRRDRYEDVQSRGIEFQQLSLGR